ncbi:MAG: polysaccharide pyruvyl transferase family protein [Prevotella sp.]
MLNLYKGIIEELEKRGYEWELFCNGMPEDYALGVKLLQTLDLPPNKLRRAPKTGDELVHDISKYKAVFGARLHACITSVSLGVPVVGLLWDKKLHYFSKTMGIRQFFSEGEDLRPAIIVDKLEAAMRYDFDINNRDRYKQRTAKFIKNFITHA